MPVGLGVVTANATQGLVARIAWFLAVETDLLLGQNAPATLPIFPDPALPFPPMVESAHKQRKSGSE